MYCGVCHSDLHAARNEWEGTRIPCVPGHEIVGRVTAVGKEVSRFKVGEMVGVGVHGRFVPQLRRVASRGSSNTAENGFTCTYNGDRGGTTGAADVRRVFLDRSWWTRTSSCGCRKLDPAAAAPLLCAGITTYSPLRHWKVGPGKKVGIVGLGGLGHMGLKLAHAMGAHVVALHHFAG